MNQNGMSLINNLIHLEMFPLSSIHSVLLEYDTIYLPYMCVFFFFFAEYAKGIFVSHQIHFFGLNKYFFFKYMFNVSTSAILFYTAGYRFTRKRSKAIRKTQQHLQVKWTFHNLITILIFTMVLFRYRLFNSYVS